MKVQTTKQAQLIGKVIPTFYDDDDKVLELYLIQNMDIIKNPPNIKLQHRASKAPKTPMSPFELKSYSAKN